MESTKYHFRHHGFKIVEVLGKAQFPRRKRRLKAQIFADYFDLVSMIRNEARVYFVTHIQKIRAFVANKKPNKFVHSWQTISTYSLLYKPLKKTKS